MTYHTHLFHKSAYASAACLLLIVTESALAAPSIQGTSGILDHKKTVTITGSGFGTRTADAPLRWDDFEAGTVGQDLKGWDLSNKRPKYASVARPGTPGTKSAHQHFADSQGSSFNVWGVPSRKFYLSGWVSGNTFGSASRNVKLFSLRGGSAGTLGNPEARIDQYPHNGSGQKYVTGCGGGKTAADWSIGGDLVISDGKWHRVEMWFDLGTPNGGDGEYTLWKDGKVWGKTLTGTFITSNCSFNNVWIQHYYASDTAPGQGANYYWDEMYVDTTPARVELGNAAEWSSVTHRELQPPSEWSSSSVSFTVNRGSFKEGETAYLYVIDDKGSHNAIGHPVTIGSGSTNTSSKKPSPPSGLTVQ